MGYYQSLEIDIEVSKDRIEELTSYLRSQQFENEDEHFDVLLPSVLVGDGLLDEVTTEPSHVRHYHGWAYGKAPWNEDEILEDLAKAGVEGTINGNGEDGTLWRWRLKDGRVTYHVGSIVYPTDTP